MMKVTIYVDASYIIETSSEKGVMP